MKTIIQTIGPLYGDDANGTVFGQPNGSVYTPPANVIILKEDRSATYAYVRNGDVHVCTCDANGSYGVAVFNRVIGQVPYYVISELATDSDFASIVCSLKMLGGGGAHIDAFGMTDQYTVVNGTTYYARLRVVTKNGGYTMATSDTYTFEGLVI